MRRLAAFGLDYLVLLGYMATLSLGGLALSRSAPVQDLFADPWRGQLLGFVVLTLPVILYFALWEGSERQATPGKRWLGLRVASVGGERLAWSRSLLRSVAKFLPWELAHACLWRIPGWPASVETIPGRVVVALIVVWLLVGLYLMLPWLSRLRQAPYDWAARSVVVDAPG